MPGDEYNTDSYNTEATASRVMQQVSNMDVEGFSHLAARQGAHLANESEDELNRQIGELSEEGDEYNSEVNESVVRRLEARSFNQRQFVKEAREQSRAGQLQPPPPPEPAFSQRGFVKHGRQAALHQAHDQNVKDVENLMQGKLPPEGLSTVSGGYRLEKHDPHHRMGDVLLFFLNIYRATAMRKPFFEWLDSLSYFEICKILKDNGKSDLYIRTNAPAFMKGVKYLDQATRTQYSVQIKGGLLYWQGKPLDTEKRKLETVFSGVGWAMWVLSPNDVLYSNSHLKGLSHHSSFLSGGKVKGAGEWYVKDGRIDLITGKSGHYKCDVRSLQESLKTMQKLGVSISSRRLGILDRSTKVVLWKISDGQPEAIPAAEFMNDPTMESTYRAIGTTAYRPAVQRERASERMGAIGSHREKAAASSPAQSGAKPPRPPRPYPFQAPSAT